MNYALVTGASRGIGKAIALALAGAGHPILINFKSNRAAAEEVKAQIDEQGGIAELLPFDVASSAEIEQALNNWMDAHKEDRITILVNNAGIRKDNLMLMMPELEWNSVIDTNLNSFFHITKPVLKSMLSNRGGRIINVVSLSGLKGMAGQTNYSAAKAGVIGATKALAQEIARKNITVNAVAPGFIQTDMTEDLNEAELKNIIPMKRFGKPEEVAAVVCFLASPGAAYITGEVISVNGGLYT